MPAPSPDCNPIELAFAKLKSRVRAATAQAIDDVTPVDIRAFYAHCGFPLQRNSYDERSMGTCRAP